MLSCARCRVPDQAFRHLYVLAAEARTVQAVDVHSKQPVYVPLRITLKAAAAPAAARAASPAPAPDGLSLGGALLPRDKRRLWCLQGNTLINQLAGMFLDVTPCEYLSE